MGKSEWWANVIWRGIVIGGLAGVMLRICSEHSRTSELNRYWCDGDFATPIAPRSIASEMAVFGSSPTHRLLPI